MDVQTELVERAQALTKLVASRARETEQQGFVSPDVIEEFCDAGFFKILVPKKYGGYELGVDAMAKVVQTIAPSCTSTGWVLAFYIGHNFLHALFPEKSQEEVFGERSFALTPGTFFPAYQLVPTDGGYVATGRSSWNSGSASAEWFMGGGLVMQEGQPPALRFFLVPRADAQVVENWDVAGLRGTASNDLVVDGAFVPEHRVVDALDVLNGTSPGAALHANPLYSLPVMPFIVAEILPVAVGTYRAAADHFQQVTADRQMSDTGAKASTKQTARISLGRGQAGADLAESMLDSYLAMFREADLGILSDPVTRARLKAQGAMLTEFCSNGINELVAAAGANAYRNDSPMQRYFRDINMMRVHATLDATRSTETLGELLLGLPPQAPV